jgi:myo-inositol-1(or 4)-monophosphatase
LLPAVAEAGELAYRYYRRRDLRVHLKADRSVVTEADRAVEALLRTAFASGTPGWAISIGVLNAALQPVAGIVSAPGWQSLFVADIDPRSPAMLNARPLPSVVVPNEGTLDANTTILIDSNLIDSKLLQTHYMRGFPGKCRSFGSTALHLCLVAQHTGIVFAHACLVYAWDVVAAHAIAARVGLTVQYLDGTPLVYQDLLPDKPSRSQVVAGRARCWQ